MVKFGENNEVLREEDAQAILVGLQLNEDISYSMQELWGLSEAAGVTVLGELIQNKERPDNATLIGKGKVEELALLCENMKADTVIFNDELSGMQLRNLEERLNVRVIDRTILILDIFASRAISREGKLQVELAQLQYRMPRLMGFGKALSRLGGGIGTRGPGEKKLETDRRHIQKRMDDIRAELSQVRENRSIQRRKRQKSGLPVVALVGYTNSGKSAIMNRLMAMTNKDDKAVFEENMLFATLDTFQRLVRMENHQEFILIDTVGFVSRLPHTLVRAFKATLEEVVDADYLLHIVDSAYEASSFHIEVTESVLKELGAGEKDKLMVYNKIDLLEDRRHLFEGGKNAVAVSAKTGEGFDDLLHQIQKALFSGQRAVKLVIPYDRGDLSSYLCQKSKPLKMEYKSEGTCFEILLDKADQSRLAEYIKEW